MITLLFCSFSNSLFSHCNTISLFFCNFCTSLFLSSSNHQSPLLQVLYFLIPLIITWYLSSPEFSLFLYLSHYFIISLLFYSTEDVRRDDVIAVCTWLVMLSYALISNILILIGIARSNAMRSATRWAERVFPRRELSARKLFEPSL